MFIEYLLLLALLIRAFFTFSNIIDNFDKPIVYLIKILKEYNPKTVTLQQLHQFEGAFA